MTIKQHKYTQKGKMYCFRQNHSTTQLKAFLFTFTLRLYNLLKNWKAEGNLPPNMSRDNRAASRAFPQELRLIIEIISVANLDNINKNLAEKSSKPLTAFAKKSSIVYFLLGLFYIWLWHSLRKIRRYEEENARQVCLTKKL